MDVYQLLKQDHEKAKQLFDKLGNTSDGAEKTRERLFAQLKQELELHAEVEEKHFYPALRNNKETKDLVAEALEEHKEMKMALKDLDAAEKTDDSWAKKLAELKANVEHHVEEEETELFPLAQKVLDSTKAEEITQAVQKEKAAAK
jgi:hemerythrin-like domain-containing protein